MSDPQPTPQDIALSLVAEVKERTVTHPWSTLAAAGGVGYVLGAGLPAFAVRWGTQLALRALTTSVMAELSERAKGSKISR